MLQRRNFGAIISFVGLALLLISCGSDSGETPNSVSTEDVSREEQNPDYAPHELYDFYQENWPLTASQFLEERIEDYDPYLPVEDIDPELLQSLPITVANLGDSMSAGAIAAYKRWHIALPWVWAKLIYGGVWYWLNEDEAKQADKLEFRGLSWSIGEGKTVRKNVGTHRRAKFENVTVTKVLSHAVRIKNLRQDQKMITISGAQSGAESDDVRFLQLDDIMGQARKISGKATPDYTTLLIGGNDACASRVDGMRGTSEYADNVSYVVEKILRSNRKARVLLVSLPNIEKLRRVAVKATLVGVGGVRMTCEDIWGLLNQCQTLTTEDRPSHRKIVEQQVLEYNAALVDISQRMATRYGDRIRFADIYDVPYEADDLSFDCFHPNISGQNKLSEYSWRQTWWSSQNNP